MMSANDADIERKIGIAKQKKDVGDEAFKKGEVTNALRAYHETLMYLVGITKNMPGNIPRPDAGAGAENDANSEVKTEVDEILEKVYSNMAACHIKNGNWKRALETAEKALAKNPKNAKALFRKGKALGELGYFEKSDKILSDLLTQDTADAPRIKTELERLRAIDKEREKKHNQKFRGFLNRDKGTAKSEKTESPEDPKQTEPIDESKRFEWIDEPADAVSDD